MAILLNLVKSIAASSSHSPPVFFSFVLDHVSAPYTNAGLNIFPFSFTGIFLSYNINYFNNSSFLPSFSWFVDLPSRLFEPTFHPLWFGLLAPVPPLPALFSMSRYSAISIRLPPHRAVSSTNTIRYISIITIITVVIITMTECLTCYGGHLSSQRSPPPSFGG